GDCRGGDRDALERAMAVLGRGPGGEAAVAAADHADLAVAPRLLRDPVDDRARVPDRKSTRLNSSHVEISYAVFCLKKKKTENTMDTAIALVVLRRVGQRVAFLTSVFNTTAASAASVSD